jgi:hypothetical protein
VEVVVAAQSKINLIHNVHMLEAVVLVALE